MKSAKAPTQFRYYDYYFRLKNIVPGCATYEMAMYPYDDTEMTNDDILNDMYDSIEELWTSDEFRFFFTYNFLFGTEIAITRVNSYSEVIDDVSHLYVQLLFKEDNRAFSDPFDTANRQYYLGPINVLPEKYTIPLDCEKRVFMNGSFTMRSSASILTPTIPCLQLDGKFSYKSSKSLQYLLPFDAMYQLIDHAFSEGKPSTYPKGLEPNRYFFINQGYDAAMKVSIINIKVYGIPSSLLSMDYPVYSMRHPIYYEVNKEGEFTSDSNLISSTILSTIAPGKSVSVPIQIKKDVYSYPGKLNNAIRTTVCYRDLVYDDTYDPFSLCFSIKGFSKKDIRKDQSKKFNSQYIRYKIFGTAGDEGGKNVFRFYKKKFFQKWKDVDIPFIVDGPMSVNGANGIEVLNAYSMKNKRFIDISWLVCGHYIDASKQLDRFVAIGIPDDIWKQKFKDLTIDERGCTPFCKS